MTAETETNLTVAEVLTAAKRFFTGAGAVVPAWIETESATHLSFATFRSNIVVAAMIDPKGASGRTQVRVSSLRDEAAVRKFLTFLETSPGSDRSGAKAVS